MPLLPREGETGEDEDDDDDDDDDDDNDGREEDEYFLDRSVDLEGEPPDPWDEDGPSSFLGL